MGDYLATRYGEKNESYFNNARRDYVAALPANPRAAILELGCGAGATGALALEQRKCSTYVGIEMFASMAEEAKRHLTDVHVGNVESMDLPYDPETFDSLICSEVLEHLTDPAVVLRRLVRLLKPGGRVFASAPNVAHWRIILGLVGGRFEYREQGPMDHTHLRWFTPGSFRKMFEDCGVEVDALAPVGGRSGLAGWMSSLPLGHLFWYQIDLHGKRVA